MPFAANIAVEVAGVCVIPGDYIYADASGAVVIPAASLQRFSCRLFLSNEVTSVPGAERSPRTVTGLNGPLRSALIARADELFTGAPTVEPVDVLADKLP
ncbi:hypothetical protein GCM10027402_32960 [Arthrobacter monumenti]